MEENTKKAYLVIFAPTCRVIVDTNGKTMDEIEEEAINLAIEKMGTNLSDYINFENLEWIEPDTECPAQPNE